MLSKAGSLVPHGRGETNNNSFSYQATKIVSAEIYKSVTILPLIAGLAAVIAFTVGVLNPDLVDPKITPISHISPSTSAEDDIAIENHSAKNEIDGADTKEFSADKETDDIAAERPGDKQALLFRKNYTDSRL